MMDAQLYGTLDALILKTVATGARHGYGIARYLEETTDNALRVEEGSLYPALYRLEHQGLLSAEWGDSENNRKAKYYTLTAAGRKRLKEETADWRKLASAISTVLDTTPGEI
jgi:PadR family transcriptional regulator PadR